LGEILLLQLLPLHAIHTACGIETMEFRITTNGVLRLHAIHTACGIETASLPPHQSLIEHCMQFIPLAVLKLRPLSRIENKPYNCMQFIPLAVLKQHHRREILRDELLHAIHTACGIETSRVGMAYAGVGDCMQFIPLAVLKQCAATASASQLRYCMQFIPLAVLKRRIVKTTKK